MAAREAFNGAPGPVYLEIPRDVLDREVDVAQGRDAASRATIAHRPNRSAIRATSRSSPTSSSIPSARRSCTASRSGPRAATRRRSRCCADSTFPAISTARSRGLLPPGDPHHFDRTRGKAFAKADVIVIVGTPFDFRMGYGNASATT